MIPVNPPKKNPTHAPGPQKKGVRINAPTIALIAAVQKTLFVATGWSAPVITKKKSIVSTIMEIRRRNKIIFPLTRSKPVKRA